MIVCTLNVELSLVLDFLKKILESPGISDPVNSGKPVFDFLQ